MACVKKLSLQELGTRSRSSTAYLIPQYSTQQHQQQRDFNHLHRHTAKLQQLSSNYVETRKKCQKDTVTGRAPKANGTRRSQQRTKTKQQSPRPLSNQNSRARTNSPKQLIPADKTQTPNRKRRTEYDSHLLRNSNE